MGIYETIAVFFLGAAPSNKSWSELKLNHKKEYGAVVAKNLRDARAAKGLSLKESRKATGISRLADYESGEVYPQLDALRAWECFYGICSLYVDPSAPKESEPPSKALKDTSVRAIIARMQETGHYEMKHTGSHYITTLEPEGGIVKLTIQTLDLRHSYHRRIALERIQSVDFYQFQRLFSKAKTLLFQTIKQEIE